MRKPVTPNEALMQMRLEDGELDQQPLGGFVGEWAAQQPREPQPAAPPAFVPPAPPWSQHFAGEPVDEPPETVEPEQLTRPQVPRPPWAKDDETDSDQEQEPNP